MVDMCVRVDCSGSVLHVSTGVATSHTLTAHDAKKLQREVRRTTLEQEAQSAEARLLEFTKLAHPTTAGSHVASNTLSGQQRVAPDTAPASVNKSTEPHTNTTLTNQHDTTQQ